LAVYERKYQPFGGRLTERWSRFLVLPRYAYRDVFASRMFLSFYVLCFVVPLGAAVAIYLPHNLKFLKTFGITGEMVTQFFGLDKNEFFLGFLLIQGVYLGFLVALDVGPALISRDLGNNGLPLYLARPFSRSEYVLGKSTVLIILLSAITWVPGVLLVALQTYLSGWTWFREHWQVLPGIFLGSWIWILVLCMLVLAFSAYLKSKPVTRVALFGIFFVASAAGEAVNFVLDTRWGSVLNIGEMIGVVWVKLFGLWTPSDIPGWAAWIALLSLCGFCLWLLARKVRAYEVVRG